MELTTRSSAEILREAATLIGQPGGWMRGRFCDGDGYIDLITSHSFCMTGAMQRAAGIERAAAYFALPEYDLVCRVFRKRRMIIVTNEEIRFRNSPASFSLPNGMTSVQTILASWNNYFAESADEVVEVLLAAADLAEAEEREQQAWRERIAAKVELELETPSEELVLV